MLLVCHHGPASSAARGFHALKSPAQKWRNSGGFMAKCGGNRAKMWNLPCTATKPPLFGAGTVFFTEHQKLFKGTTNMRKIILAAAAGALALTVSACSEKTEDAAAETADSAAADTAANADAMGEAVDATATDAAATASDAAATASAAATDAAATTEAAAQGESTTEAKAD
jgi:hypothetical protein